MKKIPTLFERVFQNHKLVGITERVTPGFSWVLDGEGEATIKYDGACCALLNGKFYKRYDAKRGKQPPEGAIPCCPPDPVTGHWPHWVPVDPDQDNYGWARLCQVIANYFGGDLSIGVDLCRNLDCDNYDNGVYIIRGWDIVGRHYFEGEEQRVYNLEEMVYEIDQAQPEKDRLYKDGSAKKEPS